MIAIRIGIKGEEPPPSEPGAVLLLGAPVESRVSLPPLPLPPAWSVPFLPSPAADFTVEPPAPSADLPFFEPLSVEPLPAWEPMPLVDLEPPERFDSLGGLPVAVCGASSYW